VLWILRNTMTFVNVNTNRSTNAVSISYRYTKPDSVVYAFFDHIDPTFSLIVLPRTICILFRTRCGFQTFASHYIIPNLTRFCIHNVGIYWRIITAIYNSSIIFFTRRFGKRDDLDIITQTSLTTTQTCWKRNNFFLSVNLCDYF